MPSHKIKRQKKRNPFAPIVTVKFCGRVGFGLHADTVHLLNCIRKMYEVTYKGNLELDFTDVDFIYPSAINVIVIAGQYLINKNNCFIRNMYPKNEEVKGFLIESGFADVVGVSSQKTSKNNDQTFKIAQFNWANNDEIDRLISVIETELCISLDAKNRVHENFAELINNVSDHSQSQFGCYVIGQAFPQTGRIRYCIGDAGIGIKTHLSKKYPEYNSWLSCDVIAKATEYGVTGSTNNMNSGIGLAEMKELVHICGGSFMILSEDGLYEEIITENDAGQEKLVINKTTLDFSFQGTFVDIILQSDPTKKIVTQKELGKN
jgi:hypothetical protein